jgi:hypothetical protein
MRLSFYYTAEVIPLKYIQLFMEAELKQLAKLAAAAASACAVVQYPNPAESEIIFNGVGRLNLGETIRYFYRCRQRNYFSVVKSQYPAQPAHMHINRHKIGRAHV